MSVTVALAGAGTADELRSLHEWLSAEEELRGRVRLVQSPPPPNALGSVPEMLTVALAPGEFRRCWPVLPSLGCDTAQVRWCAS